MVLETPIFLEIDDVYEPRHFGYAYHDAIGMGVTGPPDGNELQVTATGTNMYVNVAAGACWVRQYTGWTTGMKTWDRPAYRVQNNAQISYGPITQNLSGAAGTARFDVIGVEVLDAEFSGVSRLGQITYIQGTPGQDPDTGGQGSSSGVPRVWPWQYAKAFLPLARVRVMRSATTITSADIVDLRQPATPLGGRTAGALATLHCYSPLSQTYNIGIYSQWCQSNTVVVNFSAGIGSVTFPVPYMAALTSVVAGNGDYAVTGNYGFFVETGGYSKTGFTVRAVYQLNSAGVDGNGVEGATRINYVAWGA